MNYYALLSLFHGVNWDILTSDPYLFIGFAHFGQQVVALLIHIVDEGVQLSADVLKNQTDKTFTDKPRPLRDATQCHRQITNRNDATSSLCSTEKSSGTRQ